MTSIAIVVFLYVIIAIVLVNTLSIEFIFSSAPTVCECGWSPSGLVPQMGNITLATRIKQNKIQRNIKESLLCIQSSRSQTEVTSIIQFQVGEENRRTGTTPRGFARLKFVQDLSFKTTKHKSFFTSLIKASCQKRAKLNRE